MLNLKLNRTYENVVKKGRKNRNQKIDVLEEHMKTIEEKIYVNITMKKYNA